MNIPTQESAHGNATLEQIKRYAAVAWDRRHLVLLVWAIVLVPALILAHALPNVYSSSTMILVERQKVPEDYVRSTVTETMQERLNTISQQILSRSRIRQIIEDYDLLNEMTREERILTKLHLLGIPWLQEWGMRLHFLRDPTKPPNVEGAVSGFQKRVSVAVVGTQAFSVGYEGYDPVTVMRVTNAIADMFITENLRIREARAEGTTEFLEAQLELARKELEGKEAAVQAFKSKNLGALPEQLDANLRTLDRLQLELQHSDESLSGLTEHKTFVQRQLLSVEQQLAEMSEEARAALSRETPMEHQLAEAEARLAQLRTKYTDKFPEVAALKAQIEEFKNAIANQSGDNPTDVKLTTIPVVRDLRDQQRQVEQDLAEARSNHERLERDFKDYKARVEATPEVEQELQKLVRDYAIMQQNYQSLLEKQMNARLAENLERRQKGEQFLIIDPANLPGSPDGPRRGLIAFGGLGGGLALGLGLVVLFDEIRPRFRTVQDVSAILGLPVLTVVPRTRHMNRGS
jgi:succinoglycan biosynthesis transport protein ExoP